MKMDSMMVTIITRDINGERLEHSMKWDEVCGYVQGYGFTEEDEILLIAADGVCIYSGLMGPYITWDDVIGFFA